MVICQILSWINNPVHIGLHQVSYDINVFISSLCWRLLNVYKPNYIFVVKEFEKFDFSDNPFCINQIFESLWHFLYCNLCLDGMIKCGANDTIGTMANLFNIFILLIDNELSACTIKACHTFGNLCFYLFRHLFFVLLLL